MSKIQIDDLTPEAIGVVEIVNNDELDIIVGAMAPGTGFMTSVCGYPGQGDDHFRV